MKATKTLNAVVAASLFAGASLAQAASYDVTGTLDGFSSNPSVISAIFNPESPVFTGVWDVDTASLTGTSAFGAYSVGWSLVGTPVGTTDYLSDEYQLSSTSASYDAGSLGISNNPALRTSQGLASLRRVGKFVNIAQNPSLRDLIGLDSLLSVPPLASFRIVDNPEVQTCEAERIAASLNPLEVTILGGAPDRGDGSCEPPFR